MKNDTLTRAMRVATCAALAALPPGEASSQAAWRPDKPVELVVPTSAGGNNDRMVRLVQKVLQDQKLVTTPVLVLNKSGGNQHLAVVYMGQHAADPHYVMMTNPTLFTNGRCLKRICPLRPVRACLRFRLRPVTGSRCRRP